MSGLLPKPFKVITADQVRMPFWMIAADCFSVVRKKNILEIKMILYLLAEITSVFAHVSSVIFYQFKFFYIFINIFNVMLL